MEPHAKVEKQLLILAPRRKSVLFFSRTVQTRDLQAHVSIRHLQYVYRSPFATLRRKVCKILEMSAVPPAMKQRKLLLKTKWRRRASRGSKWDWQRWRRRQGQKKRQRNLPVKLRLWWALRMLLNCPWRCGMRHDWKTIVYLASCLAVFHTKFPAFVFLLYAGTFHEPSPRIRYGFQILWAQHDWIDAIYCCVVSMKTHQSQTMMGTVRPRKPVLCFFAVWNSRNVDAATKV